MPIRLQAIHQVNLDEPEAIRSLTKGQLYSLLSNQYYLPDKKTKGINRPYLVTVYTNEVFRVQIMDLKRFEVELTPGQLKRAPFVNLADLYSKLNNILTEMNRRPLGFMIGVIPESEWLLRVARYIDQQNITCAFMDVVPNAPQLDTDSQRMVTAKRNAEHYLLGQNEMLRNPKVYSDVKEVWDSQKRLTCRRRELVDHQAICVSLQDKIAAEESNVNSAILRASLTVFAVGNGINDPERLFHEQNGNAYRVQVNEITNL